MKRVLILITLLILTACAAVESPTPSPSPTATATLTPSATVTPSTTPSPSPTASPTVPIPTPLFPASQVAHSLILSTGSSPTCELPCWHDLRVGVSTQADVERVFTELLNAKEGFDFFAPPANPSSLLEKMLSIEGVYAGGHHWSIKESETGRSGVYYLYAYMDESTGLLSGIKEIIDPYRAYKAPTILEVVERLGEPDWVYGEQGAPGFVVAMIYEEGIRIILAISVLKIDDATISICFDNEPFNGSYTLVDPYVSLDREDWSPLKKSMQIPSDPAPYIDGMPEMSSIDEFIEFIYSDDPCFEIARYE